MYKNKNSDESIRVGKNIYRPDMDECTKELWLSNSSVNVIDNDVVTINTNENNHESYYPRVTLQYNNNILLQDNYNLLKKEKWSDVNGILDKNIPMLHQYNSTVYYVYGKDHTNTTMFSSDNNVLTINFMNIQDFNKFFRSIMSFAKYINGELFDYFNTKKPKLHNHWMILDYPSDDLIRRIRDNNDYRLKKRSNLQSDVIQIGNYLIYINLYYHIQTLSGSDADIPACLRRKTIINSQGQSQELIKTNNKCVNNKMNKWFIRQNSNFYSIVSSYDAKCLNCSDEGLFMDYCKNNNKYEQFVIKNGRFCAQFDNSKCLSGKFKIYPTDLESPRYEHLSCSSIFEELGFRCYYDQNTQVEYADEIGNWGIENGKLCGIGYERCSWNTIGYPCC